MPTCQAEANVVQTIMVGDGADTFGGRTAKLLKGPASGRGVAQLLYRPTTWTWKGEASVGVLQLLVVGEKRIARATLM